MKRYTADFETATWEEDKTWVWAWAVCEIGNEENLKIGNNIDDFITFCKSSYNDIFYFHNLKFDGEFIINWLLTHEFKHVKNKEDIESNTFTTLISQMGQFYQITVFWEKGNKKTHKTIFYDSLKIIPFSVEETAKAFNLPISKLSIDYNYPRPFPWHLTIEERKYIANDVTIMAKALKVIFDENLTKMTRASNALSDYKELITLNKFNHYFTPLEFDIDQDLRKAYKGGFTYLNPIYKEKDVGEGVVLDVNSLYPSVMYTNPMPYGEPVFFEGQYQEDRIYPLYVQRITCSFEIKEGFIPTIQIKNNRSFFRQNEYLETSNNEIVALTLTSIDLKLFLEHYNVYDLEYVAGWKFKSIEGLFTKYIDKWIEIKNKATVEGNSGQRTMSKLMLNSLYGKFATSLEVQSKNPWLSEEQIVKYELGEKEEKEGIYLPVRCIYYCLCKR